MTMHRLQYDGGAGNAVRAVRCPSDGSTVAEVEFAGAESGLVALGLVDGARSGRFAHLAAYERASILGRVADRIRAEAEALALLVASEGGKPLKDARVEVERAAHTTRLASEEATRLAGESIPMDGSSKGAGRWGFTVREPIGTVMAISAFNHPLNLIAHQVAPAIAAGCPVLVKPASTTPLSAIRYVSFCIEAGLPEPAALVVPMSGADAELVAIDPRVQFVSFIGSAEVGWGLRKKVAPGTRMALEHGGTAPVIVEPDADLEDAIPRLTKGAFYHAGQVCVSVQRIFAHRTIASELAERLGSKAEELVVGDARDPNTDVGPIITAEELARVAEWVEEAKGGGATLLCGGGRVGHQHFAPTVAYEPQDQDRIVQEEVFGPVVVVLPYDKLDEAIARANAVPQAFQASVFTSRVETALRAARGLDASAVMINDHTAFRVDWMPFGGRKVSGLGVGGVRYSVQDMTETKLVVLR